MPGKIISGISLPRRHRPGQEERNYNKIRNRISQVGIKNQIQRKIWQSWWKFCLTPVFSFENYNIYSKLRPFLNISTWRPRSNLKPFLATRFHWQRKLRQGDQELLDTSTWPFFNPGKQWSKNIKYYVFIVLAMIYLESFCEREMES